MEEHTIPRKLKAGIAVDYDYRRGSRDVHMTSVKSNLVSTYLYGQETIRLIKLSCQSCAFVGNEIQYIVLIINESLSDISQVFIQDNLSIDVQFINGSITLDNISTEGNISEGIMIDILKSQEIKKLTFKVLVTQAPDSGVIENKISASYQTDNEKINIESNPTPIKVEKLMLNLDLKVSKKYVECNDYIKYRLKLINLSSLTAKKVKLLFDIGNGLNLVLNSITLNGKKEGFKQLSDGIEIFNTIPNQDYIVEYFTKVIDPCCCMKTTIRALGIFKNNCDTCGKYIYCNSNDVRYKLKPLRVKCVEIPFCTEFIISDCCFKRLLNIKSIVTDIVTLSQNHSCYEQDLIQCNLEFQYSYLDKNHSVIEDKKLERLQTLLYSKAFIEIFDIKVDSKIKNYCYDDKMSTMKIHGILNIYIKGL